MGNAAKPKILGRDAILAAEDLPRETVNIEAWGGSVIVRTMTGTERDALEMMSFQGEGANRKLRGNVRARLLSLTLIGEDGERLFSEDDIDALGAKSSKALDLLYDVAAMLSGIGQDDIERLEKN